MSNSVTADPGQPTHIEMLVGEIIGLRLLAIAMLAGDGAEAVAKREAIKRRALEGLDAWEIDSVNPGGADRIRGCARAMLGTFPEVSPLRRA